LQTEEPINQIGLCICRYLKIYRVSGICLTANVVEWNRPLYWEAVGCSCGQESFRL